ncbi:hypothetical protein MLD38_034386 [Melastoma candidum]|uniref:Uncharacterized protein n=1 Tax=Melastoma candidum TaxID=119954 RepID=A0ACB9MB48_9MYRT|nr:hypothetical protein MLD38_034386 [Melastoma candidum]
MGRSAACFNFMACGGSEPKDDDGDDVGGQVEAPEVKSNGCGWSFRKRSTQHRVLNNSAVPESPVQNKEIPECIDANNKATSNLDTTEKVSVIPCDEEKPQLSVSAEAKEPESVVDAKSDIVEEEAAIVIIQATIRAFAAKKELLKLRKVVKMQAAVRGHLVRRLAVGTLRCVQAIVKMQALVRARYASRLLEGSNVEKTAYIECIDNNVLSKAKVKKNVKNQASTCYISIEKLLSNRFAKQLLESTPRTKPIQIKCEPSKFDSAWQWMERWMLASSTQQSPSAEAFSEENNNLENEEIEQNLSPHLTPAVLSQPTSSHEERNIVTTDTGSDVLASSVNDLRIGETPAVNEGIELLEAEKQVTSNDAADLDCSSSVKVDEVVEISNVEPNSLNVSDKSEVEIEQPRHSGKRAASDQIEIDAKKPSFGSRRITNAGFTAIQSKFEELSSAAISSGSVSPSYQENGVNLKVLEVPAEEVDRSASEIEEIHAKDNSASDALLAQIGDSKCGTELSISSTLDSPDRDKDVGRGVQMQVTDDKVCKPNCVEYQEDEVSKDLPEESADSITKSGDVVVAAESLRQEQEREEPSHDLDSAVTTEAIPKKDIPSPEASPRSHMTFPESQGTPASQASVNAKGNRAEKGVLSHKRKSLSAGKKSPANSNQESISSNSKEIPRDRKITRRHSLKQEDAEQEPKDSNSNSTGSVPHFMQATESALAKLNAHNSPRSSPDVHDRELNNKKRHSLPGPNGRQVSPHIQRSLSQAQRGGKVNGTKEPERKWVR